MKHIVDQSKCRDCEHLVSRIVIPIDYEEFGITPEELQQALDDDDYDEDNEEIALEHNTCVLLNMDIGHIVVDCNKYCKKGSSTSLLKNNPYRLG